MQVESIYALSDKLSSIRMRIQREGYSHKEIDVLTNFCERAMHIAYTDDCPIYLFKILLDDITKIRKLIKTKRSDWYVLAQAF